MDSLCLSDSASVCEGLDRMLTAAIGEHGYRMAAVEAGAALLVLEAAGRAEDRPEWFPRGKWATIQAMQERVEVELQKLFQEPTNG